MYVHVCVRSYVCLSTPERVSAWQDIVKGIILGGLSVWVYITLEGASDGGEIGHIDSSRKRSLREER